MSVYRPKGSSVFHYDFWFRSTRHRDTTHQTTREDARLVESQVRLRLRHEAGGIAGPAPAPRWAEFAGAYYAWAETHLRRPERVDELLRVVLRFWGARSPQDAVEGAPYHDLTLRAPIADGTWLLKFEQWIDAQRVSNQTANHYWGICSRLYRCALLPQYRALTGVAVNPFLGVPRRPTRPRSATLTPGELRALLTHASYHVRLAVAIGVLAPKLRLQDVLRLRWGVHLDPDLTRLTIQEHKTVGRTRRPQVTLVSAQLRGILLDARRRAPHAPCVVTYRGHAIASIRDGLRGAAHRAGLAYGQARDAGLTYHTLRHTAATLMAELEIAPEKRQAVMGHGDIQTTMDYTHLRPAAEAEPLRQLSEALPIADLVTRPGRRAARGRRPVGTSAGTIPPSTQKTGAISRDRSGRSSGPLPQVTPTADKT